MALAGIISSHANASATMKDFLLLIVAGLVLTVLFADGGLELSPTISPAFDAALNVQYSPDRSVTTIESQTNIDTNIEHQLVVVQPPAPQAAPGGVSLVDVGPGRCAVQPGDTIESEQGNGACFVQAADGLRYFINPNGNRWPVAEFPTDTRPDDGRGLEPAPAVLLAPGVPRTLEEMQVAFLRNGGELPWFWGLKSDDDKRAWLAKQEATWQQ